MNKNILWQGEILKFIQNVVDLVQEKERKKAKNQNVSTINKNSNVVNQKTYHNLININH